MTANFIPVTYDNGLPAKMTNIFFGRVQLELPNGDKIWVNEDRLDGDWRNRK